jgi:hypothetical protein
MMAGAFSGGNRGPGNAVSTFWIYLGWIFCLLPIAAAIYKLNVETMTVRSLALCWLMAPVVMLAAHLGHDYFYPRYTTSTNAESIDSFAKFKNANTEFAKEKPETLRDLFGPMFDKKGKITDEYERAENRVLALAMTMGSPIYVTQEDGNGDKAFLVYPYEVDSIIKIHPSSKTELQLLTSGKPVSTGLLKFLSATRWTY